MSDKKKNWFRIRKMGWIPCSWQGWAAVFIYVVLMMFALDIEDQTTRRLCGAALTISLIGIAMLKTGTRNMTNE